MNRNDDIELDTPKPYYYTEINKEPSKIKHPSIKNKRSSLKIVFYIILLIALIALLYICFIRTGFIQKIFYWLENDLSNMYERRKLTVLSILFFIVFMMIITGLPSQTIVCILATLIIKNIWLNFFFLTITSVFASLFIYFVVKRYFYNYLYAKLDRNLYYNVIKEESAKTPWKTAFITRILYIPTGLKDYILVMVNNPFSCFIVSSFIVHALYVIELLIVASELQSINDLFNKGKGWSEKNKSEKFSFMFGLIMVIITLAIMSYLSYWANKKVKTKTRRIDDNKIIVKI